MGSVVSWFNRWRWFAFFIGKKKEQISCEITVALADERFARKLTMDSRRFETAVRFTKYTFTYFTKPDLINLVHRVNGHIRLASRHQQFKGVRKFEFYLNIVDLHPLLVTWRAFDADGSVINCE
jgi:hypothetical protein